MGSANVACEKKVCEAEGSPTQGLLSERPALARQRPARLPWRRQQATGMEAMKVKGTQNMMPSSDLGWMAPLTGQNQGSWDIEGTPMC